MAIDNLFTLNARQRLSDLQAGMPAILVYWIVECSLAAGDEGEIHTYLPTQSESDPSQSPIMGTNECLNLLGIPLACH